jgi:hypothetical protein
MQCISITKNNGSVLFRQIITVRIIWNTHMHAVNKVHRFCALKQTVRIVAIVLSVRPTLGSQIAGPSIWFLVLYNETFIWLHLSTPTALGSSSESDPVFNGCLIICTVRWHRFSLLQIVSPKLCMHVSSL